MTTVRIPAVVKKPFTFEIPRRRGRAMRNAKGPEPVSDFQVLDRIEQ